MTTFWVSIWFKSFHLLCLKEVVFFPFPSFNLMPFWTISKMYKHFCNKKKTLLLGGNCHFCAHISAHSSRYWFFNYFRVAFFSRIIANYIYTHLHCFTSIYSSNTCYSSATTTTGFQNKYDSKQAHLYVTNTSGHNYLAYGLNLLQKTNLLKNNSILKSWSKLRPIWDFLYINFHSATTITIKYILCIVRFEDFKEYLTF